MWRGASQRSRVKTMTGDTKAIIGTNAPSD